MAASRHRHDPTVTDREVIPLARAVTRPLSGEFGDAVQQPGHVRHVVIVHQPGPHRGTGIPDAQHPGQLPGVVVAVPDVDLPAGQVPGFGTAPGIVGNATLLASVGTAGSGAAFAASATADAALAGSTAARSLALPS